MRLHDHPNLSPRREFERITCTLDGQLDSAVQAGDDDGFSLGTMMASLWEREQFVREK